MSFAARLAFGLSLAAFAACGGALAQPAQSVAPSPAPADPVAAAAIAAAQQQVWMPINVNSGFYKYAAANHLGDPQSDEFEFRVDDVYVGQVYQNGFVFAKKSNLGNIQWVNKLDS